MSERNANWTAVADKQKGDKVPIILQAVRYEQDKPDQLVEGTIVKVTPAGREFTTDGALTDGNIRFGLRQYRPTENQGIALIDGLRWQFRIATPSDVERLTDPNRNLREALDEALRDLRYSRHRTTHEELAALVSELEGALAAARALDAALANESS